MKDMKARIVCTIFVLLTFACRDEDVYKKVPEVPGDIFNVQLCPALLSNATALFPESRNNQEKYGQLFTGGAEQRIVLTKDADVYVSFVTEAANLGNVLGFYTYNKNSVPGSSEDIEKQLIFPNVDNAFLSEGDTRKLGAAKLKAGTVIGFFLIVGGYRNDGVYFKRPTFYTDTNWNQDGAKQHVLYRENECASIMVGFEDKTPTAADKDYNDIIFMVSDNTDNTETTSFDIQNVVSLSR